MRQQIMQVVSDTCPSCGAGPLGIYRGSDGKTYVVLCSECESIWRDPDAVLPETAVFVRAPDYTLPGSEVSIAGPAAGWATRAEVEARGWARYVQSEGP